MVVHRTRGNIFQALVRDTLSVCLPGIDDDDDEAQERDRNRGLRSKDRSEMVRDADSDRAYNNGVVDNVVLTIVVHHDGDDH